MNPNTAEFDAVIFDMDGVIIDSKEQVESFWNAKLEEHEILINNEDLDTKLHGRPARLIIDDLFKDLPEGTRSRLADECERYDESIVDYTLVAGAEALLAGIAEANIRLGLVTSALTGKISRMLDRLQTDSPFHVIISADLVENGKPDPECYLLAADKLGVDPERILVFEDSVSGVSAASGAGSTVIGINERHLAELLNKAGATMVIPDFSTSKLRNDDASVKFLPLANQPDLSFTISAACNTA